LASAAPGIAATAARSAAAKLHRYLRDALEPAEKAIDWAEKVIFPNLLHAPQSGGYWLSEATPVCGSSLPFHLSSAISPTFIARLIKGCRVDARADCLQWKQSSTFNALTSILAAKAPFGRVLHAANRRAKCPS
jgi:hypothetical protein